MPPIRKQISRDDLKNDPYTVWNAFIDLLAMSDHRDLQDSQRPAHLVFWYESEVQNGGHLQFVLNRGPELVPETVESLRMLGAEEQAKVLERAAALWNSKPRSNPSDVEDYIDEALEFEFEDLDSAFGNCPVELTTILEKHLSENICEFNVRA